MFKLMTDELVRTLCSERNTLGLGQCVIPAASIHEAAFVKLGTFVIKRQPCYPWQPTSYEYLAPLGVKLRKTEELEETTVLCDSYKAMDMQTSTSVNIATLQFLGLSGSSNDKYSLECHLGKVCKVELDESHIKNYRVPKAVVTEFNKTTGKKVLAIVTTLYIAQKPATIHFIKKESDQEGVSAHKGATTAGAGHEESEKSDKSFRMVKGQVMAYCIQDCKFIPANNTFSLPLSGSDDEIDDDKDKKKDRDKDEKKK